MKKGKREKEGRLRERMMGTFRSLFGVTSPAGNVNKTRDGNEKHFQVVFFVFFFFFNVFSHIAAHCEWL